MTQDGPVRRILHVDMDTFHASVEQRDDPALRGKPVAVAFGCKSKNNCQPEWRADRQGLDCDASVSTWIQAGTVVRRR